MIVHEQLPLLLIEERMHAIKDIASFQGGGMKDLKPVKAYRVRFEPDSNARYLVYISESLQIPSFYGATIVAMNIHSLTPDDAYTHWNKGSATSLDDLRRDVDKELRDLNPGKTIFFDDERWIERT